MGASLVKFNAQWITGEALLKPTFISGNLLTLACLYVIALELFLSPFVIYGSRKASYFIFSQLVIFHLFSWHIVGYLYPLMMLFIISIFPLLWFSKEWNELNFHLSKIIKSKSTVIFLGVFYLAQTGPLWFKGDSSQTGEGRIFSLNMLDAKVRCEEFTYLKYKDKTVEVSEFNFDEGYRIGCDPLLRLSLAKHHCRERSKDPEFIDLDFEFFSKKKLEDPYRKMIQIFDFCKSQPSYSMFHKNSWIMNEPLTTGNTLTAIRPLPDISNLPSPSSYEGKGSGWIYAFDKSKSLLWSFYANESFIGVTPKPLEDETFIYFLSGNGRLYSLYKKSGTLRWSAFYDKKLSLSFFIEGEKIHLKTEKEKIIVDKKTGEILSISE
jgi:outer membrane protein assembly factor BamB